jgi:DNA-binding PadR family transcriptional regulator
MLELAILGFLKEESMHGYELKQRLAYLTGHVRPISDGALYPAISRLEKQGLLVKEVEPNQNGMVRQILSLTPAGEARLLDMLRHPSDVDISDRNRFFTILAFLKYLPQADQRTVLERRLAFLEQGKSFFSTGGKPVKLAHEADPFRRGMLFIARETSRVEKAWLREMIEQLVEGTS